MIEKPGIYQLPESIYHGNSYPAPCLSAGVLKKLLLKSPKHAWLDHPALNPDYAEKVSANFDVGTAAHSVLLEGVDNIQVIDAKDWRTNEAKQAREVARMDGYIPLLPHQKSDVMAMVAVAQDFLKHSELGISDLCAEGTCESSWVWQEEDTWLKIRPDWISLDHTIILDYKTTDNSANPDGRGKHILNMGYHLQDALYRRGVRALTETNPTFVFLFQECEPPHMCSLAALPSQFADMGDWQVERGIEIWRKCLAENDWPGYPDRICYPDVPGWAYAQWLGEVEEEGYSNG